MTGGLRGVLIGLVLIDLMFVKITEASRPEWIVPLFILAAANPFLIRFRHRIVYRVAWNGAIVAVFSVLVHHATSGGVRFLLEDGLMLAALCQVHLLNNIGPEQKPDLLFFNSFLIPVVTCFLSGDVAYLILFLVYAPMLVLGLELYILTKQGRSWSRGLLFSVARDATVRSVFVVGITLLLFFVCPRDFHRRGLVGGRIRFQPVGMLNPGFTEEVNLERGGVRGGSGDSIVMKIRVVKGEPAGVPTYWRGGTLTFFNGSEWAPGGHTSRQPPERKPDGAAVGVHLLDTRAGRLFAPLSMAKISLQNANLQRKLTRMRSRALLLPGIQRMRGGITYAVTMAAERPRLGGRKQWYRGMPELQMPNGRVPMVLIARAELLRRALPSDAPQHQVVESIRAWLTNEFEYLFPGEAGAAGSLAEFASGDAGGHCEFFASALVMMLRSQGIPARFVAGYRSVEWSETGRVLTVRERNAHAWVEAEDPVGGWYAVDATPPAEFTGGGGDGLFAGVGQFFSDAWDSLKGLDDESRENALAWLAGLPGRIARSVRNHPWSAALVVGLLAAWFMIRRRLRPLPPTVRDYLRSVHHAGMVTRRGETPRELLDRARLMALPPKKLHRLESATTAHETVRYRRGRTD